uniref:UBP34/UBP24/USP9X/USP9Y-like ARM repeat region domain-containing protein n=1 Tax=Ascaris lumbricoides TaxID=6252 RepID=A0A0M3HEX8_ASCLU
MQEQEDIDPKALDPFFETRILKLPVDLLNEEGFSCFKTFWTAVNKLAGKLVQPPSSIHFLLNSFDLEGHDYLWEIILKARDNVSRRATELWVDIFSNPHADMVSDVGQLNEFVINKCFTMLKANHDELIKGGGDDFEKIGVINRMSRILFALHCYICAFDEDCAIHERSRPPLLLACLGHCFILTVLFPGRLFYASIFFFRLEAKKCKISWGMEFEIMTFFFFYCKRMQFRFLVVGNTRYSG